MKNGLLHENGELIYYKNGSPYHAGVIKIEGDIYYIGKNGIAVKGEHVIHKSMANGILKRGTYRFGEDCKLIEGFYIPPEKKKKKTRKFKKLKKIIPLVICFVIVVFFLGYNFIKDVFDIGENSSEVSFEENESSLNGDDESDVLSEGEIVFENLRGEITLCSPEALKYFNDEITITEAIKSGEPYKCLVLRYDIKNGKNGKLLISENENMLNPLEYDLDVLQKTVQIDNLKTGTDYYYRVICGKTVINGSFSTTRSNRFVSFPGMFNARDIGGYETLNGKTVKQGMIIRGAELDGMVELSYHLDKEKVESVLKDFNFVYDFDLRNEKIYNGDNFISYFGEEIDHRFYNCPYYGGVFDAEKKQIVKQIFSDLASEDKYPMYLHCTHGADRTGTVVFLLQGILGVPEEQMMKEYRLTAYSNKYYAVNTNMEILLFGLENFEGDTINEKIESFLKTSIGVTDAEIESIRNILLEN